MSNRLGTPWLALCVILVCPAIFLATVQWGRVLSSDILELLPESAEPPLAQTARTLIREQVSNPVLFRVTSTSTSSAEIAYALRGAVAQQASLDTPYIVGDPASQRPLYELLKAHRDVLLAPEFIAAQWTAFQQTGAADDRFPEWFAQTATNRLNAFLDDPRSLSYTDEIPSDPLLLLPSTIEALPPPPSPPSGVIYAWIPTREDSLQQAGQYAIRAALDAVEQDLSATIPDLTIESSGVYEIARESERRTKAEVARLNAWMAVVIFGLLVALAGRPGLILLMVPPLLAAVLWCLAAGILVFGQLHTVALAVASVVLGLAVDYAIHLAANRHQDNLAGAWHRVRLPLITSCASTCFGFLFLLLSPMPALRQVGVMVPCGLVGALLAVRWLLPWIERFAGDGAIRPFLAHQMPPGRQTATALFGVASWLGALAFLTLSNPFEDDVKAFQIPIDDVLTKYQQLIEPLKDESGTRWFTVAKTPSALSAHLTAVNAAVDLPGLHWPTPVDPAKWRPFASALPAFEKAFRTELAQNGFEPDAFAPFFERLGAAREWNTVAQHARALRALAGKLDGPAAALLITQDDRWISVYEAPSTKIPSALAGHTYLLAEKSTLDAALGRARTGIGHSAIWGLLGVTVVVGALYGLRRGALTLAVPAWAVTNGIATAALIEPSLGLLAVIGAVLAFCLALDYGAFVARTREPPASIRMSAATTFCAFAVLATSTLPALAEMGLVVAASVLFAWMASEFVCLPPSGKGAKPLA